MDTAGSRERARLHRAWRAIADYLSKAPGTHVLLLIIAITTWMQRGLDETTATRILRHASTNLFHMTRDAPRVLFLSAFLLDRGPVLTQLILFTLLMVPVERWIGTYRWLAVFAAGHIGATLATTVGIWLQVRSGNAGASLVYPVDVGVSYGLLAVAAVLPLRLPRPANFIVGALLIASVTNGVVSSGSFTTWGHAAALAIGFALAPLVRPPYRETAPDSVTQPRGRFARGWHWLVTPPNRPHWSPSVQQRLLGIVALTAAVGLVIALAWTGDADLEVPPSTTRTQATVIDPNVACGSRCAAAVVRYRIGSNVYRETLRLPAGTSVQRRESIAVEVDPQAPQSVRLPTVARRVHVAGLLGATAAALAFAAAILLVHSRPRRRRRESR